jgi:hypothetical protein
MEKTSHIKAILSVPVLYEEGGDSPSHKVVGVINIDAITREGAEKLQEKEKSIAEYFMRLGKKLGRLKM